MSKSCRNRNSSSLTHLINDLSDPSLSSIPYADDDESGASDNESKSFRGRISLDHNVDLSILVHLSDSEKEQSDSKLDKKDSRYPVYLPGFVIKVHNIGGSLKRNSISMPTGLNDRDLDSLRFKRHIPDGGREFEDITKSVEDEKVRIVGIICIVVC